ncbi:hypothetical protein AKO1_007188 [Acrasis kona]|uniref:Uncharacterized protein n=1 Tax=Acrasis kona TaxID=1008807 RepID=A0AAW2YT23_9EUKA
MQVDDSEDGSAIGLIPSLLKQDNDNSEDNTCIEHPKDLLNINSDLSLVEQINASSWTTMPRESYDDFDEQKGQFCIPDELFDCINVKELSLGHNALNSLSPLIYQLTQLCYLDLSYNQLTTLPPDMGRLRSLNRLDLTNNRLKCLPDSMISGCVDLRYLSVKYNQLQVLCSQDVKCNWAKIKTLDLGSNQLQNVPQQICDCTSLEVLNLSYNVIENPIPSELKQLKQLSTLFLNGNKLKENMFPNECLWLGSELQPPQIKNLELGENNLSFVPTFVWYLNTLISLGLDKNPLQMLSAPPKKKVPVNLLTSLQSLDLFGTPITELPALIKYMTSLTNIDMRACSRLRKFPNVLLEGSPSSLCNLISIDFSMSSIDFVPSQISNLTSLRSLSFDHCKNLTRLPNEIATLPNLEVLSLSHCDQLVSPPRQVSNMGFSAIMAFMSGSLQLDDINNDGYVELNKEATMIAGAPVTNSSTLLFLPMLLTSYFTPSSPDAQAQEETSTAQKFFSSLWS